MLMLFLTVALVHIIALMSPGPDFFFVSQTAISRSRREAMMGVLGITCGVMIWAGVALLGLNLILAQMAWLHNIIMVGGGLYLCWMGYQMLRGALKKEAVASAEPQVELARSGRSFVKGLLTNLANPKAIIYFGSVFSLFVGDSVGAGARWGIFPADYRRDAGLVYGGCQPVRPAGDAPRLSADGEVDRWYRRYAVCGIRHPPDYLALTGMLFPTRLFPGGKVSVAKPLQLIFSQTGHFHNSCVINTAFAHCFGNLQQGLVFTFFYALLYAFLHTFCKPCFRQRHQ